MIKEGESRRLVLCSQARVARRERMLSKGFRIRWQLPENCKIPQLRKKINTRNQWVLKKETLGISSQKGSWGFSKVIKWNSFFKPKRATVILRLWFLDFSYLLKRNLLIGWGGHRHDVWWENRLRTFRRYIWSNLVIRCGIFGRQVFKTAHSFLVWEVGYIW